MNEFGSYMAQHWGWVVGPVIAIILISVPITIYVLNKRRAEKGFTFRVLTDTPLISRKDGAKGKIEILYEGNPVKSMRVVEIELRSTGGKEIVKNDFDDPVRIVFPQGLELFETEIVESSPDGFQPRIEQVGSVVMLAPSLMNPGDRLTVKVLVPSDDPVEDTVTVTGRIAGVSRISRYEPAAEQIIPLAKAMTEVFPAFALSGAVLSLFTRESRKNQS